MQDSSISIVYVNFNSIKLKQEQNISIKTGNKLGET